MVRNPTLDSSGLARAAARLATFVPGYAGYKNPNHLFEDDRGFRKAVAHHLGISLGRLKRALSRGDTGLTREQEELTLRILTGLERHRDRVRFAPSGSSAFLSQKRESGELEGLVALDAELWGVLEEFDRVAGIWDQESARGNGGWPGESLEKLFLEWEEVLDERESYLRS